MLRRLVFMIALFPALSSAQEPAASPPPSTALPSFGFSGANGFQGTGPIPTDGKAAAAALGFGQIGDDYYARVNLGFDLNLGKIGLGIQAPLELLVYQGCGNEISTPTGKACTNHHDANPMAMPPLLSSREEKAYGGVVRRTSFDETSDYMKFIRYVRYGHKGEPVHLQVGELAGMNIGHGTLVGRYMNNVNVDHTKFGLVADLDFDSFGFETLVDNLVSEGDSSDSYGGESFGLVAGRAYVRPLSGMALPFVRRMAIGVTYAVDRRTPVILAPNPSGSGFDLNREGNFVRDPKRGTLDDSFRALGFDIEVPVLENSMISLIPYVDYNVLADVKNPLATPLAGSRIPPEVDAGSGLHLGTLIGFRFPIALDITLSSRLEYRYLGQRYLPNYFDASYDLQRYQYPLTVDANRCRQLGGFYASSDPNCFLPKAAALGQLNEAKNGIYGELAFRFLSLLTVGGGLEDYDGPENGAINLYASLPALKDYLTLSAFYSRRAIEVTKEAFDLDERSILGLYGRAKIMSPGLFLVGMFTRQWANDQASGKLSNVDNFNLGVEFRLGF